MIAPLIKEINDETENAFDNFRLRSMKYVISKNECEIFVNYRKKEGQEYRAFENAARIFLPESIRYRFHYALVGFHEGAVKIAVRNALSELYQIQVPDSNVKFCDNTAVVSLPSEEYCRCVDGKVKTVLLDVLDSEFCRSVALDFVEIKSVQSAVEIAAELSDAILENLEPMIEAGKRMIEPYNIERYIGDLVEPPAMYVRDVRPDPETKITLCGRLSNVRLDTRNSSKTPGKTFTIFRAYLTDFTGAIPVFSFVSEANLPKFQELDATSCVIVLGVADKAYNSEQPELKLSRLSYCEIPSDLQEAVFKKGAPLKYKLLTPQQYVVLRQGTMFGESNDLEKVNPYFIGKSFVVFDTETTGLSTVSDRIVEIACVKIVDGKITEHLATLVNPSKHIPAEATKVNHITDEMVESAPKWKDVVGDVYKFCEGSILVGHNVNYDLQMLNNTARETHYYFENANLDTMAISRRKVRNVPNHTLATLLRAFGLVNENAHRALDDTIATAQLFIKLMTM